MKPFFTLLIMCFSFLSCRNKSEEPFDSSPGSTSRYLALGDSYTVGENVNKTESYPYQLTQALKAQNIDVGVPAVIARTGWTTDELILGIKAAKINTTFDLVTLLIGVNNQYRGYSKEVYRQEFKELLASAIKFANGNEDHVFVLSIPDWGVTPFGGNRAGIAEDINRFNAIIKEETFAAGVSYTDITEISRQNFEDTSMVADDGLHPSGKMYKLWVEKLLPEIESDFVK